MPKRGLKKVLASGICTSPPSASAAKNFSASASSATVSDSDTPAKLALPWQWPSEPITREPPILSDMCITLSPPPGGIDSGAGLSLDRKSVVQGKSVSVRVDLGGRRIINKKHNKSTKQEK